MLPCGRQRAQNAPLPCAGLEPLLAPRAAAGALARIARLLTTERASLTPFRRVLRAGRSGVIRTASTGIEATVRVVSALEVGCYVRDPLINPQNYTHIIYYPRSSDSPTVFLNTPQEASPHSSTLIHTPSDRVKRGGCKIRSVTCRKWRLNTEYYDQISPA